MTPLAGNRENLWQISIHMPHTWHDVPYRIHFGIELGISIHMPHTWHDRVGPRHGAILRDFNPHATYVA